MRFFVGDYTRLGGPGVVECDLEQGIMTRVRSADTPLTDPTYMILSKDQTVLYVTCGDHSDGEDADSVASFRISDAGLKLLSIRSTGGSSACHLTLSEDERFLYAANYNDGSLSVHPVNDGVIGSRIQLIRHEGHGPDPVRQAGPHAHFVAINPDDERLYAVDLGIDAVMIYTRDSQTGLLTADERLDMPEGMGPRHLVFHRGMMYVAHELGGAVSVVRSAYSGWEVEQTISTIPEGCGEEHAVAAIRAMGDRVYVSNRENDSISEFEIRKGGTLALERMIPTFGSFPRDFVLLGDGLFLVANQNSGDVRLIEAAPATRRHRLSTYEQVRRLLTGVDQMLIPMGGCMEMAEPLEIAGAVCVCPAL